MTHPQQRREEQSFSFTITQFALGSPLQFEPALGSKELDNLINNYVPGSAMPQQKRAQVVLEFLNSIDALSYTHPVSIRYHVPQILTPQMMPRHSSMPSMTTPSPRASYDISTAKEETLSTSKSTSSLKRSREEVASPNASSAKRLPGFSIMTKDGIDITDLASRGPKTKEQRDHAALMRRLKACAACKKSKQRCDPSHHRPAQSALSTTSSATPSNRSARLSCNSSAGGSRGSISPQSSLGESFSQSPTQGFADRAIAQTGQCFPPFPTAKPSLSPSEFTLPDTLLADSDLAVLPMQDFDPELFQLADMELDSWNANFTAFPPADNNTAWNSHEDIFASNYGSTASTLTRGVSSSEQVRSNSLPHVTTFAEQVLPCQEQDRQSRQPSQLVRDAVYTDSHGVEFDIDQWLHSTTDREDRKDLQSQLAANGPKDMFKDNPFQRGLQNPVISRDQDYILYPDSPQFDWGLEPYQISRDIGSKDRRPRKEPESGTSTKRPEDASPYEQDSQRPTSAGVRISSSNYQVPGVQSAQLLEVDQPYRYLLSPSPSDGSADVKGICVSDSNASEADDTAYDTQDALSQCSTQFNYDQSSYAHSGRARLNVVQQQCDVTLGGNDEVDGNYRVVRRTRLSPDYLHNLRPVISADVDAGSQFQSDQCDSTQFERPQGSPSGLPMPGIQDHTMNFLDDQQAQETLTNRLLINTQDWDHIWKERDLRRAGLLGVPIEGNYASRLRVSSHEVARARDTADDVYDAFEAEARRQSWRTTMSSDLTGKDGGKYFSIETLTQQRLVLSRSSSQRNDSDLPEGPGSHQVQLECSSTLPRSMATFEKKLITIMTLCMLMTISLLWTLSFLIAAGNDPVGKLNSEPSKQTQTALSYSWNATAVSSASSHDDLRPISVGHDYGSPSRYDPGPGLDYTTSIEDFLYSGSGQVNYIESSHILDSRPESETLLIDDNSIHESFSDQWKRQPSPSPAFSSLSDTPAFTMAPSATKSATTWTTHLPARSTSQPEEAYRPVSLQSQRESCVQSPSSKFLPDLKRAWSRRFNIGHLTMRITSLTIISG